MSQWRCKLDGAEIGPVSFQELAELVREGKMTEGAQVRREGGANWEPAWHVPGLLRAAGIVEEGELPIQGSGGPEGAPVQGSGVEAESGATALTRRERGHDAFAIQNLLRALIAAAVGLLAVGFFYRWAYQTTIAFPMPPTTVDGELIDSYFPVVGRCTMFECALLYVDVFALAAAATWFAARDWTEKWGTEK